MYELSLEVWKFTDIPPASRNFKYCDQIREASDSAHRNVAEGFGRFNPPEFVRFLDIARAPAEETWALLQKGHATWYLTDEQFKALDSLAVRGLRALAKFQRYLRSPAANVMHDCGGTGRNAIVRDRTIRTIRTISPAPARSDPAA